MKRRTFIKSILLLQVFSINAYSFFEKTSVSDLLETLLKKDIKLKLGADYYDRHVVELFIRDLLLYNHYSHKSLPASMLDGKADKDEIERTYKRYSRNMLERYILSTNILLNESKISYKLYYDPYINVCSNFLAKFDHT